MIGRVFSIIFYVPAGAFLCLACLMFFAGAARDPRGLEAVGLVLCFPYGLPMLIGSACARFRNAGRDLGIVFISGAGTAIALILLAYGLRTHIEAKIRASGAEPLPPDYVWGFSVSAAVIVVGILMIAVDRYAAKQIPQHAPPAK